MAVGGNYTLSTSYWPFDAVETGLQWTTSNSAVATVTSGGKVIAQASGHAYIIATSMHGSGIDSCYVWVQAESVEGAITDIRDGEVYGTVTIGEQTWLAENMRYLPIVHEIGNESVELPRYYVYGYSGTNVASAKVSANYTAFGVLYNWPAAYEACPAGWHLPTTNEWQTLINYVGSDAGLKLKSESHGGLGDYGLNLLLGGYIYPWRYLTFGEYLNEQGYWWSATNPDFLMEHAYYIMSKLDNNQLVSDDEMKRYGYSVRCVKD